MRKGNPQDILLTEEMEELTGRVPPNAVDVEQKVLGAIMLDNEVIDDALMFLKPEYFYRNAHTEIFRAMIRLKDKKAPIDLVTIREELTAMGKLTDAGDVDYLLQVLDSVSTAANTDYYSQVVREQWIKRDVIKTAMIAQDKCFDPVNNVYQVIEQTEARLMEIQEGIVKKEANAVPEVVDALFSELDEKRKSGVEIDGIPTGYDKLDELTGGFQKSELIVIAGRPSHGKTAFAMNIAQNAASRHKKKVAVFSIEMSEKELLIRMAANVSKVNGKKLKIGKLDDYSWQKVIDGVEKMREMDIFIDDSSEIGIMELRAKARKLKAKYDIDMIVVDYLQLVKGRGDEERRDLEVAYVSRGLKALAKDLGIPVVACAQLNRGMETRKDKRPIMADLRESGAIEQDADMIIFVYREVVGMHKGASNYEDVLRKAEIIIGKQRNGPIGEAELVFISDWAGFENKAHEGGGTGKKVEKKEAF